MKKRNIDHFLYQIALSTIGMLMFARLAAAEVTLSQNDKLKVDLYGQVNRAVLYARDGNSDEFYHVDNDNSSTRFGIKTAAKPSDKLTAGANLEFEYQSDPSNYVNQLDANYKTDPNANRLDKRILEVYLSGAPGKLSVGHGSTASDNTAEVDLSGTNVVGYSCVQAFSGGMLFFNRVNNSLYNDPKAKTGTIAINDAFNNLDGLSRKDRLRYDSPAFFGLQLATSVYSENGDDAKDVALSYSADVAGGKAAAAAAYVEFNSASANKNQYSGSASLLLANGLNLTTALGTQERRDCAKADAHYYYGKIGYVANIFSVGTTNVAAEYGSFYNYVKNEDRGDVAGFLCVQNLKDWSTELYMGYRFYDLNRLDDPKMKYDYKNIDSVMAGMRLKF